MKFKISVSDLQYAIRTVKDVTPKSAQGSPITGVLIVAKGDRAIFTAFNPEMMAKAAVKIDPIEDGSVVVDAAALYSAISHFQPENADGVGTADITLSVSARNKKLNLFTKTTYVNGTKTPHKRTFPLLVEGFFPDLPSEDRIKASFELPSDTLMDGVESVSYAMSSDVHMPVFTGMLFKLEDNFLTLFATDGVCLAEFSAPVKYEGEPQKLVIPGTFAIKLAKSFFASQILTFVLTENMIFVHTPNLVLGGTLIKEEYPDYKSVIPSPKVFAEIDKHILLDNLNNLTYEASQTDANRVKLHLDAGEASLYCGQSENSGIPGSSDLPVEFECNLKLFANSIKNVFGDKLKIGFTDSSTLLQFSSEGSGPGGAILTCMLVPLSAI